MLRHLQQRGIPAVMAGALFAISHFSTVGSTVLGYDVSVLLTAYTFALLAIAIKPRVLLHQLSLPLSVFATWGRAEGFGQLAHGGVTNVWGTAALFAALTVVMITWHWDQAEELNE